MKTKNLSMELNHFCKTKGQSSSCKKDTYHKQNGESCKTNAQCISYFCNNGKCLYFAPTRDLDQTCVCDYHCKSGHCSYWYWAFGTYYKCTKN